MLATTALPKFEPWRIPSRSMSPVEMWGIPRQCVSNLAWVPLPEPGEPNRTRAITMLERAPAPANAAGAGSEPFIVPHDELRFHLVDGIHGDTHHDQQRGAAEVESDAQSIQNRPPHVRVDPVSQQRQVLQLDAGEHDIQYQAQDRKGHAAQHSD